METWQELKVTVKREGEELVSNLLIELGSQGVAIENSMDYVGNVDRFGEIFPEVEQQEEIVVKSAKRSCKSASTIATSTDSVRFSLRWSNRKKSWSQPTIRKRLM